jgi:cell division septation protein DedD
MDQANALVELLNESEYNIFITQLPDGDRTYFRVRIGYFPSREDAVAESKELSTMYDLPNVWIVRLTTKN